MFNMLNKSKELNELEKIQGGSKEDMEKLLQILFSTEDIELQIKLFSLLAIYIMTNNTYKVEVITSDLLYEKIYNVLRKGLPLKTARTLDFVSALLYSEKDEGLSRARSLTLHAQNMLRRSGSLAIMSNLFAKTMLHQETWRALCCCLAECCRDSFENQSYCSHLVPLCVQKCIYGNLEVFSFLKSLIHSNEYNMKLFFENNGIIIFRRKEALQYDTTMQLLNIVIQQTPTEMLDSLFNTVFENLKQYKELFGTQTKVGQWAVVNLYHISTRLKAHKGLNIREHAQNGEDKTQDNETVADISIMKHNSTTQLIQNIFREIQNFNNSLCDKRPIFNNNIVNSKEGNYHKVNEISISKQFLPQNIRKKYVNNIEPRGNEMSFSFLLKQPRVNILEDAKKYCSPTRNSITKESFCTKKLRNSRLEHKVNEINQKKNSSVDSNLLEVENDAPSLLDFKPIFVSTPKHVKKNVTVSFTRSAQNNSTRYKSTQKVYKSKKKYSKYLNASKNMINSQKDLKQRSISSRLFDAINDSCTTFVKTVKNIFKSKTSHYDKNDQEVGETSTTDILQSSCSYSFTNYMRKRDAILSNEKQLSMHFEQKYKFCRTCNDTGSLQRKVINNSYLKETVKKLKLGINLYGCDFKKISRSMWPREAYMTPEVLYNLYRKLIVK